MTLDRILATGRGRLRARLELEGWPSMFVTHTVMEQVDGDGRERISGLKLEGMKIGARLDLPTGKIEAEGFRVQIVDATRARKVIAAFRTKPSAATWLSAYVSASATTIPVFSTEGFASSGVIHIKTEAIAYSGKTATTFTGCTRGHWNTAAQAHFTQGSPAAFEADAAGVAYPAVTNRPETIEGRRAWLYLYGDGDGIAGDGHQRWQGSCSTSPRYEGAQVTFGIDPPTSILKQEIGGDVAAPIGIRGIYYPWSAPFVLALTESTNATTGNPGVTVIVRVVGFFEDQQAFCDALTAAIAAALGSFTGTLGTIEAQVTASGFELVYTTPATGFRYVEVNSALGGSVAQRVGMLALGDASHDRPLGSQWVDETGTPRLQVSASSRYTYAFESAVPRAYWGNDTPWVRDDPSGGTLTEPTQAAAFPGWRLYLAGLFALSADVYIAADWGTERADDAATTWGTQRIELYDEPTHSIIVPAGAPSLGAPAFWPLGPNTRFRVGRLLAAGNVGDLITNLVANSPALANAGAMPLVRSGDVVLSPDTVNAALTTRAVSDRVFAAFGQDSSLEDITGPELVAAGMHWTITPAGQLTAIRARLAAKTEAANHSIAPDPRKDTGAKPIGGLPTLEEAATWGFVSKVVYLTGYDFIEDEHVGPEVHFNNVQASAPNRIAKALEIAQKSMPGTRFAHGGLGGEPTQVEVGQISRFWLGLLGGKYDILSIRVPFVLADAQLGDSIAVTSKHVPNDEGGMGIVDKLGILIGYTWDLDSLAGSLELLMHSRRIAGYAPSFLTVNEILDGGNSWFLECDVASETDKEIGYWLRVGDRVRVRGYDTTSPLVHDGVITSVEDGATVLVTFDGPFNPAADSAQWVLGLAPSATYASTDRLADFCFSAFDEGIGFSDVFVPAQVLAP